MTQGQRLKKIRKMLELSQDTLGAKLNVSKQYISNLEADRNLLNNEKLVSLLIDFNVNLNYLLGGIGEPFNPAQFEDVKDEILKEVEEMLKRRGIT
jgi:transcriptional regulator with XRE-family HTH domain